MSLTRRSFLETGTLTAVSAGVALGSARLAFGQKTATRAKRNTDFPTPLAAQRNATFAFTSETFQHYVGDIFQAPNARGRMVSLTLIRVDAYKMNANTKLATKKALQPDSFSLTFRAAAALPKLTSIHKVSHPALGQFDLFLTPRQADNGALLYEAVFNHVR